MDAILPFELPGWAGPVSAADRDRAIAGLEAGKVLFFPNLRFALSPDELEFLAPGIVGKSKNVSYDPRTGSVGHSNVAPMKVEYLRKLMDRFARSTRTLLEELVPSYQPGLTQARTSLRPVEIAGRVTSWRKDDTRLHVDSFPSQPTKGKRILRVFSNINRDGKPRVWKIGEPFEATARRFWPRLPGPGWGSRHLLAAIRVTKSLRTRYDHYMLRLHDAMKTDPEYQYRFESATHPFPAGSTWACFTDQVSHAAVSGCHQLEQTFAVDVGVLKNPDSAPLRVLEGLAARRLA